ncbi:MAG: PDZ domain-containing protein [Helicobacteraceae bacterium]|nr:PDZ domain-containing protein [Helicobacteraceae bacterium]
MNNKKYFTLGFVSVVVMISLLFSTSFASDEKNQSEKDASRLESLAKFTKVLSIVERYNVDKLTIEELMDKAMSGMLGNIDAHSSYLDTKKFKNMQVSTKGEFGGLGITVGIRDGALTVISPIDGTPADKAGLEAGDIILKIDDKSSLNMTIDEAVSHMRGKVGDPIELAIVRKSETRPLTIHIIRDIIKIDSVYAKQIGKDILYIRVASFDRKVVKDVKKAIKKYSHDKGIVLDLRNNPGGLLDQAVGLVDLFVNNGVIVSQKGRDKSDEKKYKASSSKTLTSLPLVVLINAGSASASEIVSGSLQDHKRAVIIGENTFGKGSVQLVLPVTDEEAIKLTIARYYLPSGRTIQAVGVKPDIEVASGEVKNYDNNFSIKEADLKKHLEGELEKIAPNDKKKDEKKKDDKIITKEDLRKDIQLKEAVDILKALIIMKG